MFVRLESSPPLFSSVSPHSSCTFLLLFPCRMHAFSAYQCFLTRCNITTYQAAHMYFYICWYVARGVFISVILLVFGRYFLHFLKVFFSYNISHILLNSVHSVSPGEHREYLPAERQLLFSLPMLKYYSKSCAFKS